MKYLTISRAVVLKSVLGGALVWSESYVGAALELYEDLREGGED